ncbi:histone deacetylase 15 isoform X1 [Cucurbita moschata]|uniref:histone deacetylase n=2 Tax=Cucurbita moschata TaxID=3662 RepID=A0A6J1EET5_CUCMO|nr:histone deacetylase 15 isoform X1 [Cucurbita moschata]XP_022925301.1 histone deacetylase 15 isoform X1 [Cucurbita moschata]XP_022925303.1 histone deacetylase 15 isoform X1 [Cucurbita moschata]
MVSEILQQSHLVDGEAEVNLQKQGNELPSQILNGRHGKSGSDRSSVRPSLDYNCGDDNTGIASYRDVPSSVNIDIQPDTLRKKARQQREMTFQDMCNNLDIFEDDDEDDDDDSDWEPLHKLREIMKWFCTNCTMANLDVAVHCDSCGEHRESGILKHGFFAPSFLHESTLLEAELETRTDKGMVSQVSTFNSSTAIGFDERMLLHSEVEMKSHPHPERPDRLRAIAASLATAGIFPGRCYPIPAREITKEELEMVHSAENIQAVEVSSNVISCYFTPDTYANKHSAQAARLAAGLCADLASEVFSGRAKNGFALVRPPGHHAGVKQAMGFCLHNNAAVSALAAQAAGAKKVLIVDWDVHHGNGTQEIFEQNKSVLYISLHRHEFGRFYPGTGAADEVGTMGAEGYCVNVPWSQSGVGDNDYIFAFKQVVLPIASAFAPDLTIISAGFDAARGDPLGMCDVTPAGYAQMTYLLNIVSGGKLLVILEGGYNLRSISSSATAVIKVLLGESPGCDLDDPLPSRAGMKTVLDVLAIQKNFWPVLESSFSQLQSQYEIYTTQRRKPRKKRGRGVVPPLCWRWSRKRLLYHLLKGQLRVRGKGF